MVAIRFQHCTITWLQFILSSRGQLVSKVVFEHFLIIYSSTTLETIWPHSGSNSFPALHNYMTPIHLILKRSITYVICSKSGHSCPAAWFLLDSYAVKKANPDHRPVTTGLSFFWRSTVFWWITSSWGIIFANCRIQSLL